MPTFEETLEALAVLLASEQRNEALRVENLRDATQSKAYRDETDADLVRALDRVRREKVRWLGELVRYPPFHDRHFSKLSQFYNAASRTFDNSVFIMTKYPEGSTPLDLQLRAVIDAVSQAVVASGHVPRIATDATPPFHPQLWDNVELYLLGCRRGIAIIESKYKPELNPNVAMEWGWMRGMGRQIMPLVEKDFAFRRADWGGLIEYRFDWDAPAADIPTAVSTWLTASASGTGGGTGTP